MMDLKSFVNNPNMWDAFTAELNHRLHLCHLSMEASREVDAFARQQGRAAMLRELLQLREDINGRK